MAAGPHSPTHGPQAAAGFSTRTPRLGPRGSLPDSDSLQEVTQAPPLRPGSGGGVGGAGSFNPFAVERFLRHLAFELQALGYFGVLGAAQMEPWPPLAAFSALNPDL